MQWAQQPSINNNHDTCLTLDLAKLPELPFPMKIREELELLFHTPGGNLLHAASLWGDVLSTKCTTNPGASVRGAARQIQPEVEKSCKSSSPAHVHLSLFCIQEIFVIDRSCWRWNNTPIVETVHPLLYLSLGVCLQQKLSWRVSPAPSPRTCSSPRYNNCDSLTYGDTMYNFRIHRLA